VVYYTNTVGDWISGDRWNNPSGAPSCTGCSHSSYHSNIMDQDIGFNIYLLPQNTSQPTTHFPAVYFFSGDPGDENSEAGAVAPLVQSKVNAATVKSMIFVFPKTGTHEMDSIEGAPAYSAYMGESTIVCELIPFIDANFRTIASQAGRALQGFSMGGQGCERVAFKFPQLWSSIYCFAPAIDDTGSNIGTNEPLTLSNMFNGNTSASQATTVWALSTNNATAIKGYGLPDPCHGRRSELPLRKRLRIQSLFTT
jgi:enterochelin esterase-like enzyme